MHSDDSKYGVQELFDEALKVSIKPNGTLSSFTKIKTIAPIYRHPSKKLLCVKGINETGL